MAAHGTEMSEAVDTVASLVAIDDEATQYRLGRCVARMEASVSTPGPFGRVAIAQTMRDISPELMDLLGTASTLPIETKGAIDHGETEALLRLAVPAGIYGGTLEVFRNMIAQHELGLGRPSYGA